MESILKGDNKPLVVKKNKNCIACRASEGHNECSLGFTCWNYKPASECPKPLTIKELVRLSKLIYNTEPKTDNQ